MLILTPHAAARIAQRGITPDHLAAALAGRSRPTHDGRTYYYDRSSRTVLVVEPKTQLVVTAFRAHRAQAKRLFGRGQAECMP